MLAVVLRNVLHASLDSIVQEDHTAASNSIDENVGHPACTMCNPVFSVYVPDNDWVAKIQCVKTRRQTLMAIRRAKKAYSSIWFDGRIAGSNLFPPLLRTD